MQSRTLKDAIRVFDPIKTLDKEDLDEYYAYRILSASMYRVNCSSTSESRKGSLAVVAEIPTSSSVQTTLAKRNVMEDYVRLMRCRGRQW